MCHCRGCHLKETFRGGKGPSEPRRDVSSSWDTGGSPGWHFPGTGAGRAWDSPGASRIGDTGTSRGRASRDGDTGTSSLGRGPHSVPAWGQRGAPVPVPVPKPPTLPEELPRLGLSLLQPASPGGFGDPGVQLGRDTPPTPCHGEPQAPLTTQRPPPPRGADPAAPEAPAAQDPPCRARSRARSPTAPGPVQGAPVQGPLQSSTPRHRGEPLQGEPAGPRAALTAARGSGLLLLTVLAACAGNSG